MDYDLAGQVIGLAMKVHSALGPGFLESVDQNALAHELRKSGFVVETEVRLKVHSRWVRSSGACFGWFGVATSVSEWTGHDSLTLVAPGIGKLRAGMMGG